MFERLKELYDKGRMTKAGLKNAVRKGWITAAQYTEITGEQYE